MANQIDVDLDGNEYPLSPESGDVVMEIINGGTGATYPERARVNLGLGNVDNTSDLDKPVSAAQQAAIAAETAAREAAVAAEVAAREAAVAAEVAAREAAVAAEVAARKTAVAAEAAARNTAIAAAQLSVQTWLPAVSRRADLPAPATLSRTTSYLCRVINDTATPANNGVWQLIAQAAQWTYFSDNLDFIDQAELNAALAPKADLASPTFTGTPKAPTASSGTNTTQLATTAFVQSALSSKANLASPALTGTPTCPTPSYP